MYNDSSVVVWNGVVCKWGTIKNRVDISEVRQAERNEVMDFYYNKIR